MMCGPLLVKGWYRLFTVWERVQLGQSLWDKVCWYWGCSQGSFTNTPDWRSQYHNLTGVRERKSTPVQMSSKPCQSHFLCKDLKLSDTHPKQNVQNRFLSCCFGVKLINLKNLSVSQSDSYDVDDDCTRREGESPPGAKKHVSYE
jgi:hypothetical protein